MSEQSRKENRQKLCQYMVDRIRSLNEDQSKQFGMKIDEIIKDHFDNTNSIKLFMRRIVNECNDLIDLNNNIFEDPYDDRYSMSGKDFNYIRKIEEN